MKKEGGSKPLKVLRKTRKAYVVEYFCGGILLLLSFILYLQDAPRLLTNIGFVIGIVALAYVEGSLVFTRYKIMEDKIVIIKGIVKQDKKNVYFHPLGFVPDINIKQGRLQRLLGYGTIYVKAGEAHTFEIKDINRPHKIMTLIEERIRASKS